ncbi:hypothetical protein [Gordonia malaquae]|uniref:hypothetical protein n=1 Tax=Gordonia malaquae TaxID=410332 RepID=UPI0030170D83
MHNEATIMNGAKAIVAILVVGIFGGLAVRPRRHRDDPHVDRRHGDLALISATKDHDMTDNHTIEQADELVAR